MDLLNSKPIKDLLEQNKLPEVTVSLKNETIMQLVVGLVISAVIIILIVKLVFHK